MSKIIDLDRHISIMSVNQINKICQPLFDQSDVTFFRYLRLFNNGSRIILSSRSDVTQYQYQKNNYPHTWYETGMPSIARPNWRSWVAVATLDNDEQKRIALEINDYFNLCNGMDFLKIHLDSYELFSFTGYSPHIYATHFDMFKKFIFYFKEQANQLISHSLSEKITIPLPKGKIIYRQRSLSKDNNSLENFHVKRFYLDGKYSHLYLTHKEVQYLQLLSAGNSAKEIASLLNVSKRTVEHSIGHVKQKLNCSKRSELISILREAGIDRI